MKIQQIANEHGWRDLQGMSDFAKQAFPYRTKVKLFPGETVVDDPIVGDFVDAYADLVRKKELLAQEESRLAGVARVMPITSGASFEGYRITRYGGYVSGDEVATVPMGFFTGTMYDDDVNETIKKVRNVAIQELKEAAANIDCNAVIGLDFDYITLDRSGPHGTVEVKIVLTANGTAVEIEPL